MPSVRVDDIDLNYVDTGSGPALVFVHGLGGTYLDWEAQIAYFSAHFRVIVPDLRGCGRSGTGRRIFSIPRFARDLIGLLDRLGVQQFVLVGHSMGGAIAQQLALDHPQRVQKLVIANSMPLFQPQTRRHYIEFAYRWLVMAVLGPERLSRIGAQRMYPGPDQERQRAQSIARGAHNSRYSYLAALAALGRWSVLARLDELRLPVLIVGSEHDYYTREESQRFADALPRSRLVIVAGAHHALPSEMPEAFNALVEGFLRHGSGGLTRPTAARHSSARSLAQDSPEPAPMRDALGE